MYYLGIFLETLRKTTKSSSRIAGFPAETLIEYLPNTGPECDL
jgi:hypothetical protein